jgi:hypothetical protein
VLISREGSYANHGVTSIRLSEPVVSFEVNTKQFVLREEVVRDFSTAATHDYTIAISLSEFALLVRALANAASDESLPELTNALRGEVRSLLRLAIACSPQST